MNKASCRILLVIAGTALVLVGPMVACGGGEEQAPPIPSTTVPSTAATTATTSIFQGAVTTTTQPLLPTSTLISETINGVTVELPTDFVEARGQRPIVVLFYVPGEVDDEEVVEAVRELRTTYPTYAFLIYDYKMPDAYGDLADWIGGVGYQPFVALVDRTGTPRRVWSGFVDKGTLNQTLIDLGRY